VYQHCSLLLLSLFFARITAAVIARHLFLYSLFTRWSFDSDDHKIYAEPSLHTLYVFQSPAAAQIDQFVVFE
jgi:hypothetical protein